MQDCRFYFCAHFVTALLSCPQLPDFPFERRLQQQPTPSWEKHPLLAAPTPPPHHRNPHVPEQRTQNSRTQRRINFVCVVPQNKYKLFKTKGYQKAIKVLFQNRTFGTLA